MISMYLNVYTTWKVLKVVRAINKSPYTFHIHSVTHTDSLSATRGNIEELPFTQS